MMRFLSALPRLLSKLADSSAAPFVCVIWAIAGGIVGLSSLPSYALEADSILMALRPFPQFWDLPFEDQSHFFPLLLKGWSQLAGTSLFGLRLLPLLFSAMGALYVYRFAELLHGRRAALLAGLLFAYVPAIYEQAHFARMYTAFITLALAAAYHACAWGRSGDLKHLLALVVVVIANGYNHFFALGTGAMALGWALCAALASRRGRSLGEALGAVAVVGVAWLPQVFRMERALQLSQSKSGNWSIERGAFSFLQSIVDYWYLKGLALPRQLGPVQEFPTVASAVLLGLTLLVSGVGLASLRRTPSKAPALVPHHRLDQIMLLGWTILSGLVLWKLSERSDIRPRYFGYMLGPIVTLLSVGIVSSLEAGRTWPRRILAILALAVFVFSWTSAVVSQHLSPKRPYQDGVDWIAENWQPGDMIAANPGWTANATAVPLGIQVRRGHIRGIRNLPDRLWVVDSRINNMNEVWRWLEQRSVMVEQREWHALRVRLYDFGAMQRARENLRDKLFEQAVRERRQGARVALIGDIVLAGEQRASVGIPTAGLGNLFREVDLTLASLAPPVDEAAAPLSPEEATAIRRNLDQHGIDTLWTGRAVQALDEQADVRSVEALQRAGQAVLLGEESQRRGPFALGRLQTRRYAGVELGIVVLEVSRSTPELPLTLRRRLRALSDGVDHLIVLTALPGAAGGLSTGDQSRLLRQIKESGARVVVGQTGQQGQHVERVGDGLIAWNIGRFGYQAGAGHPSGAPNRSELLYLRFGPDELEMVSHFPLHLDANGRPSPAGSDPEQLAPPAPTDRPVWRALDHLDDAALSVRNRDSGTRDFTHESPLPTLIRRAGLSLRDGRRWGRDWWQTVARGRASAKQLEREGIWAHPPAAPGVLELKWEDVEIEDVIHGYCGVRDEVWDRRAADGQRGRMAPVMLELWLGDEKLQTWRCGEERGWRYIHFDTSAIAGTEQTLRFRLRSRRFANQHLLFDAWTATARRPVFAVEQTSGVLHTYGAYSFREGIERREVAVSAQHDAGSLRSCRPIGGETRLRGEENGPDGEGVLAHRYRCGTPRDQWNVVATSRQKAGGQLRDCIWAHPMDDTTLRLRFHDRVVGSTLELTMGITDLALEKRDFPVQLEVDTEGLLLFRGEIATEPGWHGWSIDTSALRGQERDVEFRVRTDRQRWRHFCFDAQILP